jgi:hypothetical protein
MAVTPAMIAVALGVAAPDSGSVTEAQWQMWIDDANMLIETQAAALSVDVATIDAAKIDYVVREAVVAQVRRPDSATQVTISVDDGSTSKTYRSGTGRVTILDEWWALLGLVPSGGQAFDVDTLDTTSVHLAWCSLSLGAAYCSCGVDIAGWPIYELG